MLAERYASEEEREERVRSDKLEANVCIASAFFELLMPGFVEIEEEKERRILEKKRRGEKKMVASLEGEANGKRSRNRI